MTSPNPNPTPHPPRPAITLRRATAPDAAATADVWLRSFTAALPTVVRPRSDDEIRDYIRDVVVPHRETWVAQATEASDSSDTSDASDPSDASDASEASDTPYPGRGSSAIVGMMVLNGGLLSQLYLAPDWRGRGIGDRFIRLAKDRSPDGLHLWAFQVNEPARRFYERHGFVAVEYTDGSGNEEREPDVRYEWRP
ncbi:GNAT family N-acetyltransferase [Streptomyces sp. NPDC090106]|uniref:GNAT family N-acetyltransferase n=1 Tax=Streptomyces sp. NPDC090106 TaxID=3365946 RepID=UPI00381CC752